MNRTKPAASRLLWPYRGDVDRALEALEEEGKRLHGEIVRAPSYLAAMPLIDRYHEKASDWLFIRQMTGTDREDE